MSFIQTSQRAHPDGEERPTQCFRRYGLPQSQRCHATIETDDDGALFVRWSNIQELYDREGEVKFVVDGNVLVHKAVGHDMQIIMPWRIQAFPNKVLQVALNDEQPGCLDPKTPANVDPVAMTDDNSESGPSSSYSSRQSKPSDAGSSSSSSSSSSVFMPAGTHNYTSTSSSSPLVLLPPVAATAAASRNTTAICSEVKGPSSFTWPATASTTEADSFSLPNVNFGVAQDARNTVSLLSSTCLPELAQAQVDHALSKLCRSPSVLPPSHPYSPSL
ncbi:hypothetical protein BGZ96_010390 [Linnemannia gamsii]|uniref:FHA domain-containing protein n=1 Tax=Linnemannia gamsii TaxID=64522 RepID=A0ABQ7JW66_9FUNG|nr:hypothetical protein BGZ96_010390 [Linnemannia gamsii]